MHETLRAMTVAPFRLLPSSVRRRLVQALTFAAAGAAPDRALRELLEMDAVLSGQIDLAAMAYGGGVHVKHRLMRYHDFFVSRVSDGDRVLDIGCGYGAVAHSVASRSGAVVVGVDSNPDNIGKARRLFPHERLTFVVGTAPTSLPAGPFDSIILSNVLEHIEHRTEFLRTIQDALLPSQWLIRVPMFTRDWRPALRQELGMFAFSDPTHFTEYTEASFASEMAASNLDIRHLQVNWGEIWAVVGRTPAGTGR
jgi:ubiquinone/menaquinone biosynthesis C-methylase UbiE